MIRFVYVEKTAWNYPKTAEILKKLVDVSVVECDTWEEVFYKRNQNFNLQKKNQQLILGVNKDKFLFEGSLNCQSFGADDFFYCANGKNCIFSCDYCYLSGMLKSGNLLCYVNIEDCFNEASLLFSKCFKNGHTLLLPISYDTDIYAMESLYGFVEDWSNYLSVRKPDGVSVEVRTKCSTKFHLDKIPFESFPYLVFTWSISPSENIMMFEKKASPLSKRLDAIQYALGKGMRVRLAFDPIIAIGDSWKSKYGIFFDVLQERNIMDGIEAVGVGGFRIPTDYLKTMRKNLPCSAIAFDSYQSENGTSMYSFEKQLEIRELVRENLTRIGCNEEKIFFY